MRLKNIPGAREHIASSEYVIPDPTVLKGKWKERFGNDNPIMIEVGTGKGRFIMDMAVLHPDINYIGIEKYSSVLLMRLSITVRTNTSPSLAMMKQLTSRA